MPSLWIVHRSPQVLAALQLLAGRFESVVSGAPGARHFEAAVPPDVVLLGLDAPAGAGFDAAGWEFELGFASQLRARNPAALWLLTGPETARDLALSLFDNLRAEFITYPPTHDALEQRVSGETARPALAPLSERASRDTLAARFARWYGDLDLPALLRALDPSLVTTPVRIRGEAGSGRGLVVRYLHAFGMEGATLAHVPCHEALSCQAIEAALRNALPPGPLGSRLGATLWLENAERLPETTQHQLLAWIQGTAQPRGIRTPFVRFVATTASPEARTPLHPALEQALLPLCIDLPPLRARTARIGPIASETLADWCQARRAPLRHLDEDSLALLEQCPWPGNLRQLEATVVETAMSTASDPIPSAELRSGGRLLAPLDRGETTPEAPPPEPPAPPSEPAPAPEPAPTRPAPEPSQETPSDADGTGTTAFDAPIGRLAAALGHEVREPLQTLRELAALPAERFEDPNYREQLSQALHRDVSRVDRLAERIQALGSLRAPRHEPVDVVALLEELLQPHEETIRTRRLLVLKELDAAHPFALADPDQLRIALTSLVDKAFDLVPDRGDLYIASRHHTGHRGGDTIRVLIRFHSADRAASLPLIDQSLEVVVAESVIQAMGGRMAVSSTEGEEALVLLDLPAANIDIPA